MTEHPAAPTPEAEARAAARKEALDEVRATCKEWGHTDDWNVESIYVSTLLDRLDSLSTDTREEPTDD